MSEPRPIFPLANEETARLKWFEAFMRGRVALEQQIISGFQALLEGAPPLPERKLLWHCALEKLLDGTRDELHTRMEKLEKLEGQIQAVGVSITKAEACIHDLNIEFTRLETTVSLDSAQAATAASHKDWRDIKSAGGVGAQKRLSILISSDQAQKEKKEDKKLRANKAFQEYYEQDLTYRRLVHRQRQGQEQLLDSIPHRVQEYGTEYWNTVCEIDTVMRSFANYLRDISSTCSSSGSALWASAWNIEPLVDSNCHTEAIEFAYHQSPIRGQAVLFGCPLELCTVGELKKIPPVLEYLLDFVPRYWCPDSDMYPVEDCWRMVNELERAWTGVESSDRAFISELVIQGHLRPLIMAYFMSLPSPILTKGDMILVEESSHQSASLIWYTWSQDPIKAAVLRAILNCQFRLNYYYFSRVMSVALGQTKESSRIKDLLRILDGHPHVWWTPT